METLEDFLGREGGRATTQATDSRNFVQQQVQPLLYDRTFSDSHSQIPDQVIQSERGFWERSQGRLFAVAKLPGFILSDWFPRTPGLYWSRSAESTRRETYDLPDEQDPQLGRFVPPRVKMELIELGGVGSIRLRPRKIDGDYCWLATAVKEGACHGGIPLVVPERLLLDAGADWGERFNLTGRVRYLQDAGLEDIAAQVHGNRPLVVFVEHVQRITAEKVIYPVPLTPVVLFSSPRDRSANQPFDQLSHGPQYTFAQCKSTRPDELERAVEWFEKYAAKYHGRILTNFDEQVPYLADAPLSYQRLVDKTYNKDIAQRFMAPLVIERLDRLEIQEVRVGHNISVGGNAVITIDSVLQSVNQAIGLSEGLTSQQKGELDALVEQIKADLKPIERSHPDESREIADAVQKAVTAASKPVAERKKPILDLSVTGLLQTAQLVANVAPPVIHSVGKIASFIQGLM